MKKLLITSMAAVAIGLYAKADDTGFTDTSENFESIDLGPLFSQGDEGQYIVDRSKWSTAATPDDGVFTVTNIADIGYTLEDGNTKALAIDTSTPLMRNAVTSGDDSQTGYVMAGDESIFFDSLVQFTATESIPEPSSEDKLVIGLFADEDPEENADLGALDNATNLVVISAVLNQNGEIVANATNIIDNTDLNVGPEEWHRLTIQVMNNSGFDPNGDVKVPGFKVFVDKKEVKVNGDNKIFHSLVKFVNSGNVLKGVAFEGKGAVDDLVFTTTDPFAGGGGEDPEPEDQTANVEIKFNNLAAIANVDQEGIVFTVNDDEENSHYISTLSTNFVLNVGSSASLQFILNEGYNLESPDSTPDEEGVYTITINELTSAGATIEIVATSTGGGDNEPTVEPGKQIECDSEEAANEVAKKVTITVTDTEAAAAGQADFIKAVVKQIGNKWVVTAEINTEATGYIPADDTLVEVAQKLTEIANATEDKDGNVTVALSQVTPGLYYSVDVSENLAGENQGFNPGTRTLATSAGTVTLKVSKPKGNSAFFKVVQHLTKQ